MVPLLLVAMALVPPVAGQCLCTFQSWISPGCQGTPWNVDGQATYADGTCVSGSNINGVASKVVWDCTNGVVNWTAYNGTACGATAYHYVWESGFCNSGVNAGGASGSLMATCGAPALTISGLAVALAVCTAAAAAAGGPRAHRAPA